jgi:hypothetical protein
MELNHFNNYILLQQPTSMKPSCSQKLFSSRPSTTLIFGSKNYSAQEKFSAASSKLQNLKINQLSLKFPKHSNYHFSQKFNKCSESNASTMKPSSPVVSWNSIGSARKLVKFEKSISNLLPIVTPKTSRNFQVGSPVISNLKKCYLSENISEGRFQDCMAATLSPRQNHKAQISLKQHASFHTPKANSLLKLKLYQNSANKAGKYHWMTTKKEVVKAPLIQNSYYAHNFTIDKHGKQQASFLLSSLLTDEVRKEMLESIK